MLFVTWLNDYTTESIPSRIKYGVPIIQSSSQYEKPTMTVEVTYSMIPTTSHAKSPLETKNAARPPMDARKDLVGILQHLLTQAIQLGQGLGGHGDNPFLDEKPVGLL